MIFIVGGAHQGKAAYAKENFGEGYQIINQYHLQVKEQLKEGKEPLAEAVKLLQGKENSIIISDEIGYGLVPIDKFERLYRETSGRVNCYFASQAEQVIRVVSGIGIRIK